MKVVDHESIQRPWGAEELDNYDQNEWGISYLSL